MEVGDYSLLWT